MDAYEANYQFGYDQEVAAMAQRAGAQQARDDAKAATDAKEKAAQEAAFAKQQAQDEANIIANQPAVDRAIAACAASTAKVNALEPLGDMRLGMTLEEQKERSLRHSTGSILRQNSAAACGFVDAPRWKLADPEAGENANRYAESAEAALAVANAKYPND
jgi:hypothetical protein